MTVEQAIKETKDMHDLFAIYEALRQGGISDNIAMDIIISTISPDQFFTMREAYLTEQVEKAVKKIR